MTTGAYLSFVIENTHKQIQLSCWTYLFSREILIVSEAINFLMDMKSS